MIEVALAVLVLAIGVLSVYVLFTSGLENANKAMEETQAAMFADSAFNALDAAAACVAQSADTNAWEDFWIDFAGGTTNIALPFEGAWSGPASLCSGGLFTQVCTNLAYHILGGLSNVVDHALRYQCDVDLTGPLNRVNVTLQVWPGEFGSTNNQKPCVFYREFRRPDDI